LLALTALATRGRRGAPSGPPSTLPLVVLVPAHDEESILGTALDSLDRQDHPPDRWEVLVLADNCTDRTAEVARAHGAEVLERVDSERLGKGHALAWALPRLLAERPAAAAVVVVDADTRANPCLLSGLARRLQAGADVAQADYRVGNPDASVAAALRYAAFTVINSVRPLGKQALGLSVGLFGTGVAYRREVLERVPWQTDTLAEDTEYHLRLVHAGYRVDFAPETWSASDMPTTLAAGEGQQARWEGGRLQLIRRWVPRLVLHGLRRRDASALHAGLELLVPSQSLLAAANVTGLFVAAAMRSRTAVWLAALSVLGQAAAVLGALRLVGAPAVVYRGLAGVPLLVVRNLGVYARALTGRGPRVYLRTARES
jgi:hypothetical protein